jgi:hypothetical protein
LKAVEVLLNSKPLGPEIFRGYAHADGDADELFNSDIGAWLPIALPEFRRTIYG